MNVEINNALIKDLYNDLDSLEIKEFNGFFREFNPSTERKFTINQSCSRLINNYYKRIVDIKKRSFNYNIDYLSVEFDSVYNKIQQIRTVMTRLGFFNSVTNELNNDFNNTIDKLNELIKRLVEEEEIRTDFRIDDEIRLKNHGEIAWKKELEEKKVKSILKNEPKNELKEADEAKEVKEGEIKSPLKGLKVHFAETVFKALEQ